jgi:hypothetical protein
MNWTGVLSGLAMLVAIGLGFIWVIKFEYAFGSRWWKHILASGILISLASAWLPSFTTALLAGIAGGSIIWGALELPDQSRRVRQGLYPANPGRREMTE